MENKYPCRNEQNCVWRMIDGELIILSEEGQWIHELNGVGLEIWNACDGKLTISEIADKIYGEFDIEKEVAEADVQSFIEELAQKGLVTLHQDK